MPITEGMPYSPIQGQSQGHVTLKVRNSSIFKIYLVRHFQWELASDCRFFNYRDNICIIRPSYRPHYARLAPVRLSRTGSWLENKKKRRKNQNCYLRPRVSGVPIFIWKGERSKSPDVKKHTKLASRLLTSDRSSAGGSDADCKLGRLRHC